MLPSNRAQNPLSNGAQFPLLVRDTEMPSITFPINLASIGINYTIDSGHCDFNEIARQLIKCYASDLTLQSVYGQSDKSINGTYFGVPNLLGFNILQRIGKASLYGQIFKVLYNSPGASSHGQEYIAKFQRVDNNGFNTAANIVSEGITQYIISTTTKEKNHHDCKYAPELRGILHVDVYDAGIMVPYIVHIQEVVNGETLGDIIKTNINMSANVHPYFIMIARKLDRLWDLYQFNHGDFHAVNTMFQRVYDQYGRELLSPRLIDVGFSRMDVNG